MAILWTYVEKRDVALKRPLQKNFTKLMPTFPKFPKELQSSVEEGMAIVEPVETELGTTNPAAEEKETKSPDEDTKNTKSIHIEIDNERTKKSTPTSTPPEDSTAAIPATSTEAMNEQDLQLNCIVDEITKQERHESPPVKFKATINKLRARGVPFPLLHHNIYMFSMTF
ncbi:hypothetical protein V6Z11_A01G107400 [Gossypium hirsutum]